MYRGSVQPARYDLIELLSIESDAAAGSTQCKAGADDGRQPNLGDESSSLLQTPDAQGLSRYQADLGHGIFEELAILSDLHGMKFRADQLHTVAVQYTGFRKLHCEIQTGLPTHRGKQRIRSLA